MNVAGFIVLSFVAMVFWLLTFQVARDCNRYRMWDDAGILAIITLVAAILCTLGAVANLTTPL